MADTRGNLAARFLSGKLGQTVQIDGGLDVRLGSVLQVSARQVVLPSQTVEDATLAKVGNVQFGIALRDLFGGRLDLRDLQVNKARFFLDVDRDGRSAWEKAEGSASGSGEAAPSANDARGARPDLLDLLAGDKVRFAESSVMYKDARNGLDLTLALSSLDLGRKDETSPLVLQGAGVLNGQQVALSGAFPRGDEFALNAEFDRISVQVKGEPDQGGYRAGFSGSIEMDIAELGQLLDVLKLDKSVSGIGRVSAAFRSEQATRYIDDLKVDVVLDTGPSLKLTGNLGRLGNPDDVSIDTRILLYAPKDLPPPTTSRRDLKLTGIDMRLIARPGNIPLREMVIATNGFLLVTGGEGPPPISISEIEITPEGLLRFGKAVLRIGPPAKPYLKLEGSVADALMLDGMDIAATMAYPAAAMFAPELFEDTDVLGGLSGGFRLAGNARKLHLSDFKASSEGTDLWRLDASGSVENVLNLSGVQLNVDANVPSGARLLTTLGLEPRRTGPFGVSAEVSSEGVLWDSDVKIFVDDSQLELKAEFDLDRENPVIGRRIESELIRIVDLSNFFSAVLQLSKLNDPGRTFTANGTPSKGQPEHANIVQPLVLKDPEPSELTRPEQNDDDTTDHRNVVQPLVLEPPEPATPEPSGEARDEHKYVVQPLILESPTQASFAQFGMDTPLGASALPGKGPFRNVTLKPLGQAILQSDIDLGITVALRRIVGERGATSLNSYLQIKGQKAQLGPINFNYGGGQFDVTGSMDLIANPDILRLSGSAGGWDFGRIMKSLGFEKHASGILNASFNVAGRHSSFQDFLASISGRATVSMRNGSIDTQLLDLAGLGVVPWLFSKNRKKIAPIVCVRAPLSISGGRLDTKWAVIETDLVQVVVDGNVDLRRKTLNLAGQPRRIGMPLSRSPWPFTAAGPIADPDINVKDGPRRQQRTDGATNMPTRRKLCVPDILQLE